MVVTIDKLAAKQKSNANFKRAALIVYILDMLWWAVLCMMQGGCSGAARIGEIIGQICISILIWSGLVWLVSYMYWLKK